MLEHLSVQQSGTNVVASIPMPYYDMRFQPLDQIDVRT